MRWPSGHARVAGVTLGWSRDDCGKEVLVSVRKEGGTVRRLMVPVAVVLVIALGSYAIFAQHAAPAEDGSGDMMGGDAGMMGGMSCSGCAMGQTPTVLTGTGDGGVVVAAGGKLIKYDATLKKVAETDLDLGADVPHEKTPQGCPMCQMMK